MLKVRISWTLTEYLPNQSGIDFTLDEGGSISGTVYEADDYSIAGVHVAASGAPNYYSANCTNAAGQFTLSNLPLDVPLQVVASSLGVNCGEWKNYVPEFWPEVQRRMAPA